MAIELKFSRPDNSIQWGFRLTGGADMNVPLTVIKVAEKSIAEEVGMKVGDLLVRVGDTPTAGLTHLHVHDLIKEAGNVFAVAVIRGELPELMMETEQIIDSETSRNGISQSVQINIKANVVDTTEIIVESGEFVEQNIKINGSIVSDQEERNVELSVNRKEQLSEEVIVEKMSQETRSEVTESQASQIKDELSLSLEKLMQPPECIKQSEVMKIINDDQTELTEEAGSKEKRWTTFLQKPDRPKPKIKQKLEEEDKEPPYRVVIQKQKKKRDEEKAKSNQTSQESTPVPAEMMAETPDVEEMEQIEEMQQEDERDAEDEKKEQEEFEQNEEQIVSEVELSLEEQLAAIQKQLLALSQLPAAIQQTLDVVTQQLTKIVGPVNDPNTEENDIDDDQEATFDDIERETEEKTELETLEEVSESGFDRDSQQGEEELEKSTEEDQPEPELEMLESTPEPEDLTPEEREAWKAERSKIDKQKKENQILSDLRQRRIKTGDYPLTPLTRPICLPGGRKWHAPDDAHPELSSNHHNMSDEMIAETISAQTEVIVGTTLGDSNTHLVRSKAVVDSNKINFLKYQPPPKTLDHLKHSEVYRLVHDMDQPARGVGARPGKAVAEEDVYAQIRKSGQEGQMKG